MTLVYFKAMGVCLIVFLWAIKTRIPSTSPQIGKKQVGGCGNQDINRQEAE